MQRRSFCTQLEVTVFAEIYRQFPQCLKVLLRLVAVRHQFTFRSGLQMDAVCLSGR